MTKLIKFSHYSTIPNKDFKKGGVIIKKDNRAVSFDSCQINNKSENELDFLIKVKSKWLTFLSKTITDNETGEIEYSTKLYETNEIKASNNRKKKALDKFCDFYEPLYKQKKVSLLFLTFTRVDSSRIHFKDLLDILKYRFKEMLNRPIRGYFWVLEVSPNIHIHYHLVIAIDRTRWSKIPKAAKLENIWGQRTQIVFIRKSIRRYLSKYLKKDEKRVLKMRSYGKSKYYK